MIQDLFPTRINLHDTQFSAQDCDQLRSCVRTLHLERVAQHGQYNTACEEFHVFSLANQSRWPILTRTLDHFVRAFSDLLDSDGRDPNHYNHALVKSRMRDAIALGTGSQRRAWCKLAFMRPGDFKQPHVHEQAAAFAVLYLDSVNHEAHGGRIQLLDPRHLETRHFAVEPTVELDSVAGRILAAPNYLWHSVTHYTGDQVRETIVVSLPNSTLE